MPKKLYDVTYIYEARVYARDEADAEDKSYRIIQEQEPIVKIKEVMED